jgi:alanine racemase
MRPTQRAEARIDVGCLSRNLRSIRSRLIPGEDGSEPLFCAVVKADAYGHGAIAAARAFRAADADRLAVATAVEAGELRRAGLVGIPILVLGPLTEEELAIALAAQAEVVGWTADFVARLPADARVHVKLDTGMGRYGCRSTDEANQIVGLAANRLVGVMTHFATADELGDEGYFDAQLRQFSGWANEVKANRPWVIRHAANSAAVFRDPRSHLDMCRCGIALYGIDPFNLDGSSRGIEPALTLASYVAALKSIGGGESVGYGRGFTAPAATRIATVPIGYGDGLDRDLGGRWSVLVRGETYPLVGRVSMDAFSFEVPHGAPVRVGDEVVVLGDGLTAEAMAGRLGTIGYEVTTRLGPRVPRVLIPDGARAVGP